MEEDSCFKPSSDNAGKKIELQDELDSLRMIRHYPGQQLRWALHPSEMAARRISEKLFR